MRFAFPVAAIINAALVLHPEIPGFEFETSLRFRLGYYFWLASFILLSIAVRLRSSRLVGVGSG